MEKKLGRFAYIDNLRLLMIIFVIMIHCAVTYSGYGGWYYKEGASLDTGSSIVFGFTMTYTYSYFMGLLFLIAGFFAPGSYDNKGFKKFLKDRFIRLGIPTLIFMFVIHPFTDYFLLGFQMPKPIVSFTDYYWWLLRSFTFLRESGPMWFTFALLIYSCIYAFFRLIRGSDIQKTRQKEMKVSKIVLLVLVISVSAFLIRLSQPVFTSILNMQMGYVPQFVLLFITGIYAYRNNWLATIQNRFGIKGLITLIFGGFLAWSVIMVGGGAVNGSKAFTGGMNWQSASFALWETLISVGMAIVLLPLFREKFNKQNKFVKLLSDNSFAVYAFHTPIIVYLSLQLRGIMLPPLVKCLILGVIGIPVCFAATHFVIRRIPLLKKVM